MSHNYSHVTGIHCWEDAAEAMCQQLTEEQIDMLLNTGTYEDAVAAFWDAASATSPNLSRHEVEA